MLDNTITRKGVAFIIIGGLIPTILLIISQFLPSALPSEISTAIFSISTEIKKWDFILPTSTFFTILSFGLLLELSIFGFNTFLTVWGWFRKSE